MKFSKRFEIDYEFYLKNLDKFNFVDNVVKIPEYKTDGLTAKECFYIFDSQGKLKPCKEVELFKNLINCKKNINLQIKMWVDGFAYCGVPVQEYLESFVEPPDWVKESLVKQLNSKTLKKFKKLI